MVSRDQTSAYQTAIAADTVTLFHLLEFEFPGGTLRFWTGYGTLTWNSNNYTGSGTTIKVNGAAETKNVESNGVEYQLAAEDSSIIAAAQTAEYQNRLCRIYTGVWDDSAGQPVADPYLEFEGIMNQMSIGLDGEQAIITLKAEDEMVLLGQSRERRRTDEDQKKNYAGDKFFEGVAALQNKQIPWGQK